MFLGIHRVSGTCCGLKLRRTNIEGLSKTVIDLGGDLGFGGCGVSTQGLLKLVCYRAKRIMSTLDR